MSCIRARHAEGVISWGLHDPKEMTPKKPLKCGRIEFGLLGFKINLSLGRVISKRIMIM